MIKGINYYEIRNKFQHIRKVFIWKIGNEIYLYAGLVHL